jgi:hypothetical protein
LSQSINLLRFFKMNNRHLSMLPFNALVAVAILYAKNKNLKSIKINFTSTILV